MFNIPTIAIAWVGLVAACNAKPLGGSHVTGLGLARPQVTESSTAGYTSIPPSRFAVIRLSSHKQSIITFFLFNLKSVRIPLTAFNATLF